jgi:Holliday junction resolvase RusA-like endonuclease
VRGRELVLSCTLPGDPFAWMRAVHHCSSGEYTNPTPYQRWLERTEKAVRARWRLPDEPGRLRAKYPEPLDEPVSVEMAFWLTRPQRRPRAVPEGLWSRPACPAVGDEDVDNLAAAVLDAMGRARVYTDDSRVSGLRVVKVLCAPGEQPRSVVRVYRWRGGAR